LHATYSPPLEGCPKGGVVRITRTRLKTSMELIVNGQWSIVNADFVTLVSFLTAMNAEFKTAE
jgi:hypothetical protein